MINHSNESELENPQYIEVRQSLIHGKGIFSKKHFRNGERLMIISGDRIDADECLRRENEEDNVYIFYMDDNSYIDTSNTTIIRFINHRCEPNAIVVDRDHHSLYLVAAADINQNDEITIDYDYPEIYEMCFSTNPACKKNDCNARLRSLDLQSLSE